MARLCMGHNAFGLRCSKGNGHVGACRYTLPARMRVGSRNVPRPGPIGRRYDETIRNLVAQANRGIQPEEIITAIEGLDPSVRRFELEHAVLPRLVNAGVLQIDVYGYYDLVGTQI